MILTPAERLALIDQLDRSFTMMPTWAQATVKQVMAAPENQPETGKPYATFREVIEAASDDSLEALRNHFEGNGELLPPVPRQ